jgi:phthalate 4,5-dioxygenase
VLSAEDNEILTRVGPGTPMGNLLRRYWIPACLSSEIGQPDGPPARVRLLGEDLVAFRDTAGAVGLIEEQCPHRGASLFYGRNEECGLRCTYHGWKFDVSGQCTDQRSEIRSFAHRIKTKAYPVTPRHDRRRPDPDAPKALADDPAAELPALGGAGDFHAIRGA